MNEFYDKLLWKRQVEEQTFSEACIDLADIALHQKTGSRIDTKEHMQQCVQEILLYFKLKPGSLSEYQGDVNHYLKEVMWPFGILNREVELTGTWYLDGALPMLVIDQGGNAHALFPGRRGYYYREEKEGRKIRVTKAAAAGFIGKGRCFYRSLPMRSLTFKDLLHFILSLLSWGDVAAVALLSLAVTGIGMLYPYINQMIFEVIIPTNARPMVGVLFTFMMGLIVGKLLISIVKSFALTALEIKTSVGVEAAIMARMLSLKTAFFKDYSAGELASRSGAIQSLAQTLTNTVMTTGLSAIFSLLYLFQIRSIAKSMVLPAMLLIAVNLVFSIYITLIQRRISHRKMEAGAKLGGVVYNLFQGIGKIRLCGAERRAFVKWERVYKEGVKLTYHPPVSLQLQSVITLLISGLGSIVLYAAALRAVLAPAEFMAFSSAYGMVSAAVIALSSVAMTIANIQPMLDMIAPILKAEPENEGSKQMLPTISGGIDVSHVSFRYQEHMPYVLDDISFQIHPGEYVAVVGKTGCGKSTLIRLLLGFEVCSKGVIYYDEKNVNTLDLPTLRSHMGVVMQDGRLFAGTIYSNIVISAPWLSQEEAMAAAKLAGLEEDIKRMPMGLHTQLPEGGGGISGGQRQRLLIARAIAPNPRLLIFDEATSALDNITQRKVCDSLETLKTTRIVIAHRLSTIKSCDRILVFDRGRLAEEGNYKELLLRNGLFSELVERQRLEE